MSDETAAPDPGAAPAEASAPAEPGGQGVAEATPEPTHEYLDTDTVGSHYVRLRVDGEDVEVPLSEALQGYSRTADYTRKTQALADQQREAQFGLTLQQALENNPQATLRILQEQYGLTDQPEAAPDEDADQWLDDPVEQRLRTYDERFQALEQAQADQDLRVALRVLHQRYGDDFDANAVVSQAAAQGRMDLEAIHKEQMFDKWFANQQAQAEQQRRTQAEDETRVAAKAALATHTGGSVNGAVEPSGNAPTLADAYYDAKRKLGL